MSLILGKGQIFTKEMSVTHLWSSEWILLNQNPERSSISRRDDESYVAVSVFVINESHVMPTGSSSLGLKVTLPPFTPSVLFFFYRYYFKKVSDEFDCGVVFEEVREDDAVLPIFEEKIIGKVEKID